ncbi:MAG: phosphatidylglycerol lysyltransferase domain-containing protein [Candidatus Vogelbacteria bacterium]
MLPQFPTFKKLELSDKAEVEAHTSKYPPYSDFNFVSMWSWDVNGEMRISELNGNLVVRFNDYLTGEPFYSFLGDNEVNDTAEKLLERAKKDGLKEKLGLVPEISIQKLNRETFLVSEDRDNFDYIIPTEIFKNYNTKATRAKKKSVKQFLRNFSPVVRVLNLHDQDTKSNILKVFDKWSDNKSASSLEVKNELSALERLFDSGCFSNHLCTGVFVDSELISFCLSEPLNNDFSSIHFCKADTSISSGTYAHVLQENANKLSTKNLKFVNIEQDLGIENMRKWKMSHGDHMFLKKYTVEYNKAWVI